MSLFDADWDIQVQKMLPPIIRQADFIDVDDDFRVGDTENQIIDFIVESSPGSWKEFPPVGVGVWKYLQATIDPQKIQQAIRVQLTNDIFTRPLIDCRKFPVIVINSMEVAIS